MMTVEETTLTEEVLAILTELSAQWERENCCHGYHANGREDFANKRIWIARENDVVVGYLLGHTETSKPTSVIEEGAVCFEIDELFVASGFRNRGIGGLLFDAAEHDVCGEADFITLSTPNKNYKSILHFYVDEMGMDFWSARLFKKLGTPKI